MPSTAIVAYQQQIPLSTQTWSDGSKLELRHAPRRQKGTSERLPAPGTPATIPVNWVGKVNPVGAKPKPPSREPIPDFGTWKRRSEKREKREKLGLTGVFPGKKNSTFGPILWPTQPNTAVQPLQDAPSQPFEAQAAPLHAQVADAWPMLPQQGDETPVTMRQASVDGDATPLVNMVNMFDHPGLHFDGTPRIPGEAALFGMHGEETPRLNVP